MFGAHAGGQSPELKTEGIEELPRDTHTPCATSLCVLPKPALGYACVTYPRCRMNDARQHRASILGARPMAPLLSPGQRTPYTCATRN